MFLLIQTTHGVKPNKAFTGDLQLLPHIMLVDFVQWQPISSTKRISAKLIEDKPIHKSQSACTRAAIFRTGKNNRPFSAS